MKKLLALLFVPVCASAQQLPTLLQQFSINDYDYRMIDGAVTSKIANETVFVTTLWEVKNPRFSYRWKVVTSYCERPIGSITIFSERGATTYDWSWDGSRAYDSLAAASCIAFANQPPPER